MAIHGVDFDTLRKRQRTPYIDAFAIGQEVVEVEMLYVPRGQRGSGVGTRIYEKFETTLPTSVRYVKLMAVDYGDGAGHSPPFWERLGFSFMYDGTDLDDELRNWMWKGVNGHPTPPPQWASDDEQE